MLKPRQEKSLDIAENEGQGLTATDLKPGRFVTISVNKITGDRSLCQVIWEVVSANNAHVLLTCRHLCHLLLHDMPATRLVSLHEHDFYAADALVLALTDRIA